MRYIFILFNLIIIDNIVCSQTQKQNFNEITSDLVNEVIKDDIGGVAITFINQDSIFYFKSFGPINKYNKFLPDTNTIFRIGSVSKSFCSVLMLKLAEERYFKLDDPIEKYLPEVKQLKGYSDSTKITFRQLASHTAGIERTSNKVNSEQKGTSKTWEERTLSAIPHTKFILKPNTKMSYSNIGYAILALAMSKAANKPYITLMENKILIPLKMNDTFFEIYTENKTLAKGTCDCGFLKHKNRKVPKRIHKNGMGYNLPGGAMYSTSKDLTKFVSFLMGLTKQKIISDTSISLMQNGVMKYNDAIRRTFKDVEYGFGVAVYHLENSKTIIAKSGSVQGYWTTYAFNKIKRKGVIIMLNYDKHLDNEGTVVKMLDKL